MADLLAAHKRSFISKKSGEVNLPDLFDTPHEPLRISAIDLSCIKPEDNVTDQIFF